MEFAGGRLGDFVRARGRRSARVLAGGLALSCRFGEQELRTDLLVFLQHGVGRGGGSLVPLIERFEGLQPLAQRLLIGKDPNCPLWSESLTAQVGPSRRLAVIRRAD